MNFPGSSIAPISRPLTQRNQHTGVSRSSSIRVVEVGPRDGLQNEAKFVDTDVKVEFINRLSKVGLSTIEVTRYPRLESAFPNYCNSIE